MRVTSTLLLIVLAVCVVGIHTADPLADILHFSDDTSTPAKFLRDVLVIAEDLKQISSLQKKAVADAVNALKGVTVGMMRDAKSGHDYLKRIINGTESALGTKLTLVQNLLGSIFNQQLQSTIFNDINNHAVNNDPPSPDSPIYNLLQGIQLPEQLKNKQDELGEMIKTKHVAIPAPTNRPTFKTEEYKYTEPDSVTTEQSQPKMKENSMIKNLKSLSSFIPPFGRN